jgi:hypothetical protein
MTIGVQAAAIQEIMPNTLRGQGLVCKLRAIS